MQIEPNRPRDERHSLLRAPEAIAAIFTVGAALFRDILRGDGEGIRTRLNARLKAQSEQRARSKMLLETQKEVRSLNQAIIREKERAKPVMLEKQNMLNRAVETHAIEALANAVTDDDIELPPQGLLKGENKEFETEMRKLISKAREARIEFREYMNSNAEKRSIEDIEAETIAADALAKQYQMELKDVKSATKSLESEKEAEMERLKNVLETHQKRIEELRKIAEEMDKEKRLEEAEALKSKSTPKQEIASEQSLREVRKEVNLANKLAKNIVQTATKAVQSAEDGNMKAVDELGNALQGDLNTAERQMKKAQKKKGRKERKMRLSAVKNVLGMMESESKGNSSPPPSIPKEGKVQVTPEARNPGNIGNQKAAPSSGLPAPVSAKPSLEQTLETASAVAHFISDSNRDVEEDVIGEAAAKVDATKNPIAQSVEDDVIDEEILKNEIELALDLEEFEKQNNIIVGEEEKYLELEEPPKELLESMSDDLDIIEDENSSDPALFEEAEKVAVGFGDEDAEMGAVQNRRRWSADDEMGDLNDSEALKVSDDELSEGEAEGELPNISDGFSIEDLKEDSDTENDEENGSGITAAKASQVAGDEGSFVDTARKAVKKTASIVDEKIEPFAGAEGKKETMELLRIIESPGEVVAREGEWRAGSSSTDTDLAMKKPELTSPEAAVVEAPKKRRRGRPRKIKEEDTTAKEEVPKVKRKRGRPRKTEATATKTKEGKGETEVKPKRKRGRPRKKPLPPSEEATSQ